MRKFVSFFAIVFCVFATAKADEIFGRNIALAAETMAGADIAYNPAYVGISYPWGDVPSDTGVCADVIIRAYRTQNVDLQKRIHEDMRDNFSAYPTRWGLTRTDKNIDHRRVLNIEIFLKREGAKLSVSQAASDYLPGDLVAWTLPGGLPHIGVVSTQKSASGRPLLVHHIGGNPRMDDVLFQWPMTGHYRYHVEIGARDR